MGWDAPWHWVILAIVVIALFGYKKMPDAARSLGRSLRIFKTEIKGMSEDDRVRSENKAVTGAPPAVESVAAPAPPAPVPTEPAAGSEAPAPTERSASAVSPADAELPATAKNDTPSA